MQPTSVINKTQGIADKSIFALKKMGEWEMSKEKITIALAKLLTLMLIISIVSLPTAIAQAQTRKTYAFIGATPNPVGVGQEVLLHVGITQQLQSAYMGWEGLTVSVTKPDGTTETFGPLRTDSTGGTGYAFRPNKAGNWNLQTNFPEQVTSAQKQAGGSPAGTVMQASTSSKLTLVVQEEPIPYYPAVPLPTEYWTRPIDAQYHEWVPITGDWLKPAGSYTMPPIPKYHPNNDDAPETAHILWTRQYAEGGLAGSELGNAQYEMGDAYEGKFLGSVIINGVLYYNQYEERGQPLAEQIVVAVNLKTGEELWAKPLIGRTGNTTGATVPAAGVLIDGKSDQYPDGIPRRLAFGQAFNWISYNYQGVFGYLWTTTGTTWMAFDALTGRWVYTITDVPSGWNLYGSRGEIYRYTVNLARGWMTMWNSSAVVSMEGSWRPHGNVYNTSGTGAAATRATVWNKTIPMGLPGSVCAYFLNDRIFGSTAGGMGVTTPTITSWAISVKPGDEGRLLFNKTWTSPEAGLTLVWTDASIEDGVFIVSAKENQKYYGFSLDTGELLWETEPEHYLSIYDKWYGPAIGYGKFYTGRTSGIVTCYDIKTGEKLWAYGLEDPYSEVLWSNNFPLTYHFITDGKVYLSYGEHSPNNPNARGAPFVCLNATTGEVIWKLSWVANWWGGHAIIGDNVMTGFNGYDGRIYAIGKGPSATTIISSPKATELGKSVLIEGTVTDISLGTEAYALRARFPHGVPAVADENMTAWMEYVYRQSARPADVKGVSVTIDVIDSNGNYRNIGTAVTDASGFFSFDWMPDIEGKYTVIATFAGSKAYWPSFGEAAFVVDPAPQEPPPPETPLDMTGTYVTNATLAIIIAIAVVGAIILLVLRKKP